MAKSARRHRESIRCPAVGGVEAIAEQWIALARQRRELSARHPGILDELELTRDVCVQTDEVQPSIGVVRWCWPQCLVDGQRRTELAAATKNAMETDGRDHIILKRARRQAEIGEALFQSGLVMRVVAVPGIRTPDVRAKWTADTGRVVVKRELIQPPFLRLAGDAGRRVLFELRERLALSRPPNEPRRQRVSRLTIPTGAARHVLPEAAHVLRQLTDDQVGAVSADVPLARRLLREG